MVYKISSNFLLLHFYKYIDWGTLIQKVCKLKESQYEPETLIQSVKETPFEKDDVKKKLFIKH